MAVVTIKQSVAALYVAVFNRAPDQAGLNAWTNAITSGQSTFAQVAAGFAAHEVFTTGLGALSNTAYVAALYTNILGSAGDAAGIANWTAQLNAGQSKAAVAALFVQAALTVDIPAMLAAGSLTAAEAAAATVRQDTLTNKANVGIYFADTLKAASNLNPLTVTSSKAGLEADPIYNASKAAIANVTNVASTVTDAQNAIAVAAGTTNPAAALLGGTFALTTAADTLTGGLSNDTFNADQTTFTVLDTINGGAGKDTLNITDSGTVALTLPAANVSNVEVINVRNVNGVGTVAAVTETAAVTFTGFTAVGAESITVAGVTATFAAGAVTAAQIATAIAGGAGIYGTITVTGALAGYTVAADSSTTLKFTSTVAGNVTDLTPTTTGAATTTPTTVYVQGVAAVAGSGATDTLAATNFVGATNFNSNLSVNGLAITGLVAGQQVGIIGNNAITNTAVTALSADYAAAATSATLNVAGGTKVSLGNGAISITGAGLTSATINSTGAANAVGGIAIGTSLTSATINAETNLTTTGLTGFAAGSTASNTLTVGGIATTVSLGTLTNVGNVNASGLTLGGVTANIGANTAIKFTGGAGNDVITSAGVLLVAGASVDAGAGTADRLVLTTGIDVATAGTAVANKASAALYKGFEELKLNNITQDVSAFTGSSITKLVLDGGAVVQNASAAQAANVQIVSSGTYNVGVTGATIVGQLDTVALTIDDTLTPVNTIVLNAPVLAGVETLQITAVDNVSISSLTSAPDLTSVKLLGAGTIGLVTGAVNLAANTVIDASAATGTVGIDASNAQGTALVGLSIKGGSGNDVLIGSLKSDVIVGGAGNDILATGATTVTTVGTTNTITTISNALSAAGDTLTGGAGNDSFVIAHSSIANVSSITDLNLGTNTTAGVVDSLWFNSATPATAATVVTLTAAQQTLVTAAATLDAAVNLVLATATAQNAVAQFTYGTDTYIVANGDANTTFTAATNGDTLVKVTGVVGTLDVSDVHFL